MSPAPDASPPEQAILNVRLIGFSARDRVALKRLLDRPQARLHPTRLVDSDQADVLIINALAPLPPGEQAWLEAPCPRIVFVQRAHRDAPYYQVLPDEEPLLAIARGLTRIRDGWTPPNGWAPRQNAPEALAQFETPSSRAGIAPSTPAATAEKAAAADVHGQPAPFEPLGTLEILVVDDSAEALASIVQVLKRHGHRVHAVTNATEALARAREARFDLVLVDYDMPGRDGPATVRALRQLTSPKAQPIIAILSTKPGWVPRWRSRRAGADGFFAKPARLSEVLGLVAKRQTEQRRDSHAASVAVGASSPTAAQSNRPLFKTDKVNPNANTPRA